MKLLINILLSHLFLCFQRIKFLLFFFFFFWQGIPVSLIWPWAYYVYQVGFKLKVILLTQPSKCRDYGHVSPHLDLYLLITLMAPWFFSPPGETAFSRLKINVIKFKGIQCIFPIWICNLCRSVGQFRFLSPYPFLSKHKLNILWVLLEMFKPPASWISVLFTCRYTEGFL